MRFTRIRASRITMIATVALTVALIVAMIGTAIQRDEVTAQGVGWLSAGSVEYLTSSGIPVMVPGWLPAPVSGTTPEIYAGGGSYSIYFYAGSSFLFITGVAGGGFPGGSEANLNVQLSVNTSVQGWPAIQDIGIPEGSDNPIYDKVMWIADGVLYTVSGNGLDSDSLSLANSSVTLYPSASEPADPPVSNPAQPGSGDTAESDTGSSDRVEPGERPGVGTTDQSPTTTGSSSLTEAASETRENALSQPGSTDRNLAGSSDGTSGAWFTGTLNDDPSDGTDGANPPFLGDDGTGGAP